MTNIPKVQELRIEERRKGNVLSLSIKDKAVLYTAYMSFLKEGGLFIPTKRAFAMDEQVTMLLTLMDEQESFTVHCSVVWITPEGAQGNRAQGVGLQFMGEEGKQVRNKIETYLAGTL
ncbi:MAG TPA: PilZ domain-containing protein, partial [Gammaproteobacteria bacterium]|nr:PilZ domain-containing protein [Gammaproteobacteria bacterium]